MPLPTKIIEAPLRLLAEYKVDCVIVGGIAAVLHGSMLLTNDVDVCLREIPVTSNDYPKRYNPLTLDCEMLPKDYLSFLTVRL